MFFTPFRFFHLQINFMTDLIKPAGNVPVLPEPFYTGAYPYQFMNQTALGQAEIVTQQGATLLDYYIANAPDVPKWYSDMLTDDAQSAPVDEIQNLSDMEILIKWKFTYAKNMILQRTEFLATGDVLSNPEMVEL